MLELWYKYRTGLVKIEIGLNSISAEIVHVHWDDLPTGMIGYSSSTENSTPDPFSGREAYVGADGGGGYATMACCLYSCSEHVNPV